MPPLSAPSTKIVHSPRGIPIVRRAALFVILAGFSAAVFAQSAAAPELHFKDLSGKAHSLSEYQGKIVVLNFWATWCLPCREEMPMLNRLAPKYTEKDIVFLAASLDDAETQPTIPAFLTKKKITLPVWTGATPASLKQFDLGEILPATLILDRDARPVFRIRGEASRKDISSRLDWLLSDRLAKAPKPQLKNY